MAITIRDVQKGSSSGPSSSQVCNTFTSDPQNGDSILVAEISYSGQTPTAPTDTQSNTYAQIGSTIVSSGDGNRRISLWLASNIVGGSSFQVTANWAGLSSWRSAVAWCFASNLAYNNDFASHETTGTNPTSGTTSPAPPPNSIFLAVLDRDGGFGSDTVAAGWNTEGVNGFTATNHVNANVLPDGNVNLMTAYKISSSTEQASWTASSAIYAALIASFSEITPTPAFGNLTLSGKTPTSVITLFDRIFVPPQASLSFIGKTPTLQFGGLILPQASLNFTGLAPGSNVLGSRVPGVGSLTLSGLAPLSIVTGILKVTDIPLEDVFKYSSPPARVTQLSAEDIIKYSSPPARVTNVSLEALHQYSSSNDKARVSHIVIEFIRPFNGECFDTPCLDIEKIPSTSSFYRGQSQATYEIIVSNNSGINWTSETIVTDFIPEGLELVSMAGDGWVCTGNVCSREDTLPFGSSFPPITLTVNVAGNAPSEITNSASLGVCGTTEAVVEIVDRAVMPLRPPIRWALFRFDIKTRMEETS